MIAASIHEAGAPVTLGIPTRPTPTVSAQAVASLTTASFTPVANSLLCVLPAQRASQVLPVPPTVDDSDAHSWSLLTDPYFDVVGLNRLRHRVWVTLIGSSPVLMTVTMRVGAIGRIALATLQIPNANAIPTNCNGAAADFGDVTTILPLAPAATSTLLGFYTSCETNSATATAPAPGFTLVNGFFDATSQLQMQTCYDPGSGAQTNSWASSATGQCCGSVVEVVQPS